MAADSKVPLSLLVLVGGALLIVAGCLGLGGCLLLGFFNLQPGQGFPQGGGVGQPESTTTAEPRRGNPNVRFGLPGPAEHDPRSREAYLIDRPQYVLSYNADKLIPNWVCWRLRADDIGPARRQPFEPDKKGLPEEFPKVTSGDYNGSGFNRGHMCPAKDRSATEEDSRAVFYMTNIVPQSPENNQRGWDRLEEYCRRLAKEGHTLYIACGPQGKGGVGKDDEGKDRPADEIGSKHRITVPAKVWKVVLVLPGEDAEPRKNSRVIAVIMPNDQTVDFDWTRYRVSARRVEKLTGLRFFPDVPDDVAEVLRDHVDNVDVRVAEPRHGGRGERDR